MSRSRSAGPACTVSNGCEIRPGAAAHLAGRGEQQTGRPSPSPRGRRRRRRAQRLGDPGGPASGTPALAGLQLQRDRPADSGLRRQPECRPPVGRRCPGRRRPGRTAPGRARPGRRRPRRRCPGGSPATGSRPSRNRRHPIRRAPDHVGVRTRCDLRDVGPRCVAEPGRDRRPRPPLVDDPDSCLSSSPASASSARSAVSPAGHLRLRRRPPDDAADHDWAGPSRPTRSQARRTSAASRSGSSTTTTTVYASSRPMARRSASAMSRSRIRGG